MSGQSFEQRLRNRTARVEADSLALRNGLADLVHAAPAGGLFHAVETDIVNRNSFALRLDPDGPIFTVTISYGGGIIGSHSRKS
jgi:hypothetical protein